MPPGCYMPFIEIGDSGKTMLPITNQQLGSIGGYIIGKVEGCYQTSILRPWVMNFLLSDQAKAHICLSTGCCLEPLVSEFKIKNFKAEEVDDDVSRFSCNISSVEVLQTRIGQFNA